MSLDHGTLNIPLAKRGNIDAQLERFKASHATADRSARKAKAYATKTLRIQAKELFAQVTDTRVEELATKCRSTPKAIREKLKADCHWQPSIVIALLSPAS